MKRDLGIWLAVMLLVGGPAAFVLAYVVEKSSSFERGVAFAGLWLVMSLVSELVVRAFARRAS
jgi:hypothetical protein